MNTTLFNEIVIYYPEGRISNDMKDSFEFILLQLANDYSNCDLIVNMEDVPSISSGCVEVLIYVSHIVRAMGRTMAVCRPRDLVRRILSMLSMGDIIALYETEDEAIAALVPEIAGMCH